ncbi:hypothetical protein B0H10DRAFT_298112 [Mycena sp. CBHHK59/15]|nr:hypothetical protein B0H10DRAFT_298112 [Mycena sp. CBHHK59/15]
MQLTSGFLGLALLTLIIQAAPAPTHDERKLAARKITKGPATTPPRTTAPSKPTTSAKPPPVKSTVISKPAPPSSAAPATSATAPASRPLSSLPPSRMSSVPSSSTMSTSGPRLRSTFSALLGRIFCLRFRTSFWNIFWALCNQHRFGIWDFLVLEVWECHLDSCVRHFISTLCVRDVLGALCVRYFVSALYVWDVISALCIRHVSIHVLRIGNITFNFRHRIGLYVVRNRECFRFRCLFFGGSLREFLSLPRPRVVQATK